MVNKYNRIATTSDRLRKAMELRNMTQAELAKKTGIDKSSISNYLKGTYEPKQLSVYKLSKALNVDEMWLWGYDVSSSTIHQNKSEFIKDNSDTIENLTKEMMDKIVNLETLYMDDGKSEIDAEDREDLAIGIEAAVTAALLAYKKRKG